MKKYLFIALLFIACHENKPVVIAKVVEKQFPRFVKNKCGEWAVQLSKDTYFGNPSYIPSVVGKEYYFLYLDHAVLGFEFQFNDSLEMVRGYTKWKKMVDSANTEIRIRDSIYKCQHSYQ